MDDNNINKEWFGQHQSQPQMPSPDVAWQAMLATLDREIPVNKPLVKTSKVKRLHSKKLYLLVLLLLLLNMKHTNESLRTQQVSPYTNSNLTAKTSLSSQQQIAKLRDTLSTKTQAKAIQNNLKSAHPLQQRSASKKRFSKAALPFTQKKDNIVVEKTFVQDTIAASANYEVAALNNKKSGIQKQKSNTLHPIDSLQSNDEENKEQLLVQAGLQWNLRIPISGTGNYFIGPSGNEQTWRILLPGAWVSIKADKNILMAEVNPFAAASFNPKPFYNNKEFTDSLSILETSKSITKVFGVSGAISFQHNITSNWWAGGGLQANFWRKGVAVLIVNEHNGSTNVSSSSAKLYALSKDDWQYFSKMQLYPHLQLTYRANNYQAGLRTGITFTSLAQDAGAKNLVFTQLFFRLPLIGNNKK